MNPEQPFEEQVDTHLLRLEAERPAPVTPAEERTGVSDVQAEVRNAVRQLRHGLDLLNPPSPGLVMHMRGLLDRIEQLVGGEQQ